MPMRARYFVACSVAAGAGLAFFPVPAPALAHDVWPAACFWAILGLLARGVVTRTKEDGARRGNYSLLAPVAFAALLLLPWHAYVAVAIFIHAGHDLRRRLSRASDSPRWYQTANNAAVMLIASAASLAVLQACHRLIPAGIAASSETWLPMTLAVVCAALAVDVGLNRVSLTTAVALSSGISWREAGSLEADSFGPSLMLALLGYPLALLWMLSPWDVLPALAPLGLLFQALSVPDLKKQVTAGARTGLIKLRGFDELFEGELHRALRHNHPVALVTFDVDDLKPINDVCGHACGDSILERIGLLTNGLVRAYDFAARLGGDGFAVLLPETDARQAQAFAERLRTTIAAEPFAAGDGDERIHVSISVGVAVFPAHGIDRAGLREAADRALNTAKKRGRNCVVLAQSPGARHNVSTGELC
jgi:diguanylate cyclase (GGDEF)-like protein